MYKREKCHCCSREPVTMQTCSYCGKENQPEATSCSECGTQFDAGVNLTSSNAEANLPPKIEDVREREAGKMQRAIGAALLLGGAGFSLLSYLAAVQSPYGGHYVIAI